MAITSPTPLLLLGGFSLLLFVVVSVLCHRKGLFKNVRGYADGLNAIFTLLAYTVFWAVPSLLGWALWVTLR